MPVGEGVDLSAHQGIVLLEFEVDLRSGLGGAEARLLGGVLSGFGVFVVDLPLGCCWLGSDDLDVSYAVVAPRTRSTSASTVPAEVAGPPSATSCAFLFSIELMTGSPVIGSKVPWKW